jgi:hypothetical protein
MGIQRYNDEAMDNSVYDHGCAKSIEAATLSGSRA